MSKITDMAKAEAEAAEAESPDEDEDGDENPAPEAGEGDTEDELEAEAESEAEDSPATPEDIEARLDTESARHVVALETIIPDLRATFEPCPHCGTLGYVAQGRPPMDEGLDECPKCKGYGVVQTPSKADGHVFEQCSQCHGNGHVIRTTPLPATTPTFQPQVTMAQSDNGTADPFYAEAARRGLLVTPLSPQGVPPT